MRTGTSSAAWPLVLLLLASCGDKEGADTQAPGNAAPTVSIGAPAAGDRTYAGETTTLLAFAQDAEDAAADLTVAWSSDVDGPLNEPGPPTDDGWSEDAVVLSEGAHTLTVQVSDTEGETAEDTVVIEVLPENTPPRCALDAPEDGGVTVEGEAVAVLATVEDDEQAPDTLTVTLTSDVAGALSVGSPDASGTLASALAGLATGTHTFTLTATDDRGLSCTDSVVHTVGSPPSVEIDRPADGDIVDEGAPLVLAATVSDGEDAPDALDLSWESDVDGVLDTTPADADGAAGVTLDDLSRGVHTLTLRATDSDDQWSEDAVTVTINGVPSAPTVTLTPDPAITSDDLVATASGAMDPDGDGLTYSYVWAVDGTTSSASTTDTLPASATNRGETWTVEVTATDGWATSAAGTASLTVANAEPALTGPTLSPSTGVTLGTTLTCSASATDPDGDVVSPTYTWTDGSGASLGTGATFTPAWPVVTPGGTLTCTASVDDGYGGVASGTASVTLDNQAPSVDTVSVSPSTGVTTATALTCAATASDPDGETPTLSYAWSAGGTSLGSGASLTLTPSDVQPGDTVTCTATATDGAGLTDSDTDDVSVDNTDPTLSSVTISPTSGVLRGDTVSCVVVASDDDGDTPTVTYAWTDAAGAGVGTTASLVVPTATTPGDVLTCAVTVTDAHGGTATGAATVTVDNDAPTVSGVGITPDPATVGDTLTCGWTYADSEGDTEASTVSWTVGGTEVGTATTLSGAFAAGDTVTCTVTPADAYDAGTPVSDSITISNSAPSVSSVAITPDPATVSDTLTCSWTFSDADGDADASTVSWSIGGTEVDTGATTAGSHVGGDTITCTVTPHDGTDAGTDAAASLVIDNTAPTAPEISISPTSPVAGTDDLSCDIDTAATDPDGDTLTTDYAWTANGTAMTAYDGSSTVPTSALTEGDTWVCTVTVDDGTDSATASATVEVCTPTTWYADSDGDGYGDSAGGTATLCASEDTTGYAATDDDCDDSDATINPGAYEACDGVDNDCDGTLDPTDEDSDADGWSTCDGDCDDSDPFIHPGMVEICDNGVDDDCDTTTDSVDLDGDGYGGCDGTDCNDHSDQVNPGMVEIDDDGLDNDCDGVVDDSGDDFDGDGYSEDAGDCDDARPWVFPGAIDIPDSGVDEDCDGVDDTVADWTSSDAIFADASAGSDYFPGSPDYPVATLGQALSLASAAGLPVVAAEGTYAEDVSATADIYGGFASDWSGLAGFSTVEGYVHDSASADLIVSGLDVQGTVGMWGGNMLFIDGEITADGSEEYAVYAVSGSLTLADTVVRGPDGYNGTSYAARMGTDGSIYDSTILGGTGGGGSNGAAGSGYTSTDCVRRYCDGTLVGPGSYCGDYGRNGGAGRSVVTVEALSGLVVSGSTLVGGAAAAGGDGGDGHRGDYRYLSPWGYIGWGGGPGGDGGDGGSVTIVDVSGGDATIVGSRITGGTPGDGGAGGEGGDKGTGCTNWHGRGGDGGDGGDGGMWTGVLGPASLWGSTVSWSGSPSSAGAAGTKGLSGCTCTGRTGMYIYSSRNAGQDGRNGTAGTGVSDFVALDLSTTSADTIHGNDITVGAAGTGATYTALSMEDGTVQRNRFTLAGDTTVTGIEATGTVDVLSNRVWVTEGSDPTGIAITGDDAMLVNNTVVLDEAGVGIELTGSTATGMANNLIETPSGGTCISDFTSTRTFMLNNLVYGCSALYTDATGDRTLAAELDFISVTGSAGGHVSADPLFTDASGGDFTLTASSPAIDAGHDVSSATYGAIAVDVLGESAPAGGGYDIGATEQ